MLRRLTALVFILALAGGTLARMPHHACDQECDMHKAAVAETSGCGGAHAVAARTQQTAPRMLTCTNCWQQGEAQAPATSTRKAPRPVTADQHPSPAPPRAFVPAAKHALGSPLNHPPSSKPAFIRHHALLI